MQKLITVSAIALSLLALALAAQAIPHVQCNHPLKGGQGLTDADISLIESQTNKLTLEGLRRISPPPCLTAIVKRKLNDNASMTLTYAHAAENGGLYTDRLYDVYLRNGIVVAIKVRMLKPEDYLEVGGR